MNDLTEISKAYDRGFADGTSKATKLTKEVVITYEEALSNVQARELALLTTTNALYKHIAELEFTARYNNIIRDSEW